MSPRTALSAGLLVLGLAATGCGAEVNVGDPTPSATTAAPTTAAPTTVPTATTAAPTSTAAAPTTTADPAGALPAAFPLPPGAVVRRVVTETGEIAATLTVPDGKIAYTYWATALPTAGYTVVSAAMVGGIGGMRFSGPGCPGDSQIGVSGTNVAVRCAQS